MADKAREKGVLSNKKVEVLKRQQYAFIDAMLDLRSEIEILAENYELAFDKAKVLKNRIDSYLTQHSKEIEK